MDYVNCKICGTSIDLASEIHSPASRKLEICQRPCLHVFLAAYGMTKIGNMEPMTYGEVLEEMAENGSIHLMLNFSKDTAPVLMLAYFNWQVALLYALRSNPELLNELVAKYNELHGKEQ